MIEYKGFAFSYSTFDTSKMLNRNKIKCPFSFETAVVETAAVPKITILEDVGAEKCVSKEKRNELLLVEAVEKVDEERWVLKGKRGELEELFKALNSEENSSLSLAGLSHKLPLTPPPSAPLTPNSSTPPMLPSSPNYHLFSTLTSEHFLQNSPYPEEDHLVDLRTLSTPNRLLTLALTILSPVTPAYATTPYKLAFNWEDVIQRVRDLSLQEGPDYTFPASDFFIIVFRSRITPNVNKNRMTGLDKEAHREANAAGNLLKYWYGVPNEVGRNLATCVWRDISDAKRGGRGPGHRLAMQETIGLYLEWNVERLRLVIGDGAKDWDILDW